VVRRKMDQVAVFKEEVIIRQRQVVSEDARTSPVSALTIMCSLRHARRFGGGTEPGLLPLWTRKPVLSIMMWSGPEWADTRSRTLRALVRRDKLV